MAEDPQVCPECTAQPSGAAQHGIQTVRATAMMPSGPMFIAQGRQALFAMGHMPRSRPGLVIVWCPAMLHEHATGLRLFSLLAGQLALDGVASLRLDYRGSGDSPGASSELTLSGAAEDAGRAIDWLSAAMPGVPVLVAGVRAGIFPAAEVAARGGHPLLLWQPPGSGAEWLRDVYACDARERSSTQRFPMLEPGAIAEVPDGCLVGFETHRLLREELMARSAPPQADIVIDVAGALHAASTRAAGRIDLPEHFSHWLGRVDDADGFRLRPVAEVARALAGLLHGLARQAA